MNAERIEVVEGPSSSLYGNYAMGGVINIVTNRPSPRTHMTAFLSEDDGATWPHRLLLDARATSYPDAVQDDAGTIHLVHDFERTGAKEVVFHRFTEADIKAGKIVADGSVLGRIANRAGQRTLNAKDYDRWKAERATRP